MLAGKRRRLFKLTPAFSPKKNINYEAQSKGYRAGPASVILYAMVRLVYEGANT